MGLQSINFYFLVTWLPTIEIRHGFSQQQAGWHLFLFQILGFIGALLIPRLMRNPCRYTTACLVASVPALVGMLGLLFAPSWTVVWIIIAGLGSGAALVTALSLISIKGRTTHDTTKLSGMAQSVGYLFAAIGPVLAGALTQATGTWNAAIILISLLCENEYATALLGDSEITSIKHAPVSQIPALGKGLDDRLKVSAMVATEQPRDILKHHPAGLECGDDADGIEEKSCARACKPAPFACNGDVLAGKSSGDDVNRPKVGKAVADVSKLVSAGEAVGEDGAVNVVDLDLPRGGKTGLFESEVKAADACKESP